MREHLPPGHAAVESLVFASPGPLTPSEIAARIGLKEDPLPVLEELRHHYSSRGIRLVETGGRWSFRTSPSVGAYLVSPDAVPRIPLSKAGWETLAIVAYMQPVTRSEIEAVRGVAVSRGTLDALLGLGWIRPGRRRDGPGRPMTWVTTDAFLHHFGLPTPSDLPGLSSLTAQGLLNPATALPAEVTAATTAEEESDED
jgi:segregation and condensation protein B